MESSKQEPLHSTFKHQRKVRKIMKITSHDMQKLDEFNQKYRMLCRTHDELWNNHGLYPARSYCDPWIIKERGIEISNKVQRLYGDWCNLREEIEMFLDIKNLPLRYERHQWTEPTVGVSSRCRLYDGSYGPSAFDLGPADWCSMALNGMTLEMHQRLNMQRIEMYSIWGFITGFVGVMVGMLGLIV